MIDLLKKYKIILKNNKINSNYKKIFDANDTLYEKFVQSPPYISENNPFFVKEKIYCILNSITTLPICSIDECNNTCMFLKKGYYSEYCSKSCTYKSKTRREKIESTMLERYGVKNALESVESRNKFKKTMKQRYGVEFAMQSTDLVDRFKQSIALSDHSDSVTKRKETMIKLYGAEHALQNTNIKNKVINTNNERYGRSYFSQKAYSNETSKRLNDREWLIKQHIENNIPFTLIAEKLGVDGKTVKSKLIEYGIDINYNKGMSYAELELLETLKKELPDNIILETKTRNVISPYELDIYFPEKNLAVEYCGLYWHCELYKEKNYHYNKYKMCLDKGIQLITVFEDEWLQSPNIVVSSILSKLGNNKIKKVYARKTNLELLDNKRSSDFMELYHVQGKGSGFLHIGLTYNSELVGCAIFKKRKNNTLELVRYATSCNIVGGFSKILSFVKNSYDNFEKIITFSDNRWSLGKLYEQTGFILEDTIPPDYYYIIKQKRYHKFNFRHKNLKKLLKENYDNQKSESEIVRDLGINRIYDCGKKRYALCLE